MLRDVVTLTFDLLSHCASKSTMAHISRRARKKIRI